MSDAAMSDAAMSDAAMSDAAMSDAAMSDAAMSDAAMSDAAMSDAVAGSHLLLQGKRGSNRSDDIAVGWRNGGVRAEFSAETTDSDISSKADDATGCSTCTCTVRQERTWAVCLRVEAVRPAAARGAAA
jgi:hypothetical protein